MNAPDTDPAAREPAPPELAAREASPRGAAARRPPARELTKILSDCRDLAVHRLILTFSAMLDRIGDMLMERANRSDIRDDTTHFLAARSALVAERGNVMAEFERRLREAVDQRIAGDPAAKTDFSKVDAENLTLIDTAAMDESVIAGNITRVVENLCDDELQVLNRGMAHLLGRPDLETLSNPLAPSAVIGAFAAALRGVAADERIKFTILKELNQSSLGDLNAIYADVNRHLANLNVVPAAARPTLVNLDYVNNRARVKAKAAAKAAARSSAAEVDVMALFKKMFAGQYQGAPAQPFAGGGFGMPGMAAGMAGMGGGMPGIAGANPGMGGAMPRFAPGMMGVGGFPGMHGPGGHAPGSGGHSASGEDATNPYWMLGVEPPRDGAAQGMPHPRAGGPGMMPGMPGAMQGGGLGGPGASLDAIPRDAASGPKFIPQSPLPPTPSGYVPGLPIIATRELGESLTRLQAGESGFDLGGGAYVRFSGIPEGKRNVLRDLQESPLSLRVNQIEAMTIELVAMLFDFIFETRDLPDGIKALIGRLQIPVLKAAMLDGAFFAKKTHPARVLVNALSEAGMAWLETMGHEDPLYREIDRIVHRILDDFADNLTIFEDLRKDLERFLEKEEAAAEDNIQSKTVEITQSDRREIAPVIASAEIERQIGGREIPNFVAALLRERWARTLETLYIEDRENSDGWSDALSTVTDLIWSVQPKRTTEERRQLVSMLPSLLKRLTEPLDETTWPMDEREQFLANLVEAHAAAVKPVLAPDRLPTAAVALQAKAEAEEAKAAGDEVGAAKAERLAHAMAPAEPPPSPVAPAEEDPFLEIAQGLDRGVWVEFEDGDGQLAFRKLAWVSPLRGTYLFCNRQGQKAMSLTAEELATRFRSDAARLVEAEPLVDRAFTSMMAGFNQKLQQPAA